MNGNQILALGITAVIGLLLLWVTVSFLGWILSNLWLPLTIAAILAVIGVIYVYVTSK